MRQPYGFIAYIDEAGDDGIGHFRGLGVPGQSHWLVLSACILDARNEHHVVAWRDEITSAFPKRKRRDLHFRDLDHPQKVHAAHVVAAKPLGIIAILSNKLTIANHPTFCDACNSERNVLYKYLLRYLLEKLTNTARRVCESRGIENPLIKVMFSRRGGMDYDDFREYLRHLRQLQTTRGGRFPVYWSHLR